MVAGPISVYFLTLNTIFRGSSSLILWDGLRLRISRELNVGWGHSSHHGKYSAHCLCDCCDERGPKRQACSTRESEEKQMITPISVNTGQQRFTTYQPESQPSLFQSSQWSDARERACLYPSCTDCCDLNYPANMNGKTGIRKLW